MEIKGHTKTRVENLHNIENLTDKEFSALMNALYHTLQTSEVHDYYYTTMKALYESLNEYLQAQF